MPLEAPLVPRPVPAPDGVQVTVIDDQESPEWDRAERFVYSIYRNLGFCEPNERGWVVEADEFRPGSRFTVAADANGDVVGTLRTVIGEIADTPTGNLAPLTATVPQGTYIDLGAMCVSPKLRGLGVMSELHRVTLCDGVRSGCVGFAGMLEDPLFDYLRSSYGIDPVFITDRVHHMGGDVTGFIVNYDVVFPHILAHHPEIYAWMREALGPTLMDRFAPPHG